MKSDCLSDFLKLKLIECFFDFRSTDYGEVVMKTLNDCWLIGKYSNSREFYVIVTQKKASLIEINDEVKKLCDNQLKGIFFAD